MSLQVVQIAVLATFVGAYALFGYQASYEVGYGAFTLMAAMISLTFLWLWQRRATPLAAGMSLSWAGSTAVMGWWWAFNRLDRPAAMVDHPILFLFLSIYFAGAVLHFEVIARSFGTRRYTFLMPVSLCIAASVAVFVLGR